MLYRCQVLSVRLWLLSALCLTFLLPRLALANCGTVSQVSVSGAPGQAVTTTLAPQSGYTWHLQNFFVACGKATGATPEVDLTITGLTGDTVPTYPINESTAGTVWASDEFNGISAVVANYAITISMPAVTNGGPCFLTMRYCP